jgi:hypothetical protein
MRTLSRTKLWAARAKKGRYIGGRFGYANGPLDVAAAYGIDTKDSLTDLTVAGKDRLKTFNLGASYDFGPVKLFGELSQVKDAYNLSQSVTLLGIPYVLTQGVSNKYNGALIGATIPVGPGLIRASYSAVKYKPDSAITPFNFYNNGSSRASQFAVGYVHNLSKRTALYATLSRISIKDGQNNPGVMGITTSGGAPGYGTIAGYTSTRRRARPATTSVSVTLSNLTLAQTSFKSKDQKAARLKSSGFLVGIDVRKTLRFHGKLFLIFRDDGFENGSQLHKIIFSMNLSCNSGGLKMKYISSYSLILSH